MRSNVFFIKADISEGESAISAKARKLFKAGGFAKCFEANDFTAVKIHIGEDGNNTYIKAECIKGLIEELLALKTKPFLTDTCTLYTGRRHNAVEHTRLSYEHDFCLDKLGVPFIVSDGLVGTSEVAVRINGEVNKEVYIGHDIARCQSILSIAHFTGHIATCMGATLKTIGMGCASKKGKLKQHAALKLSIGDECKRCGQCVDNCPADAITLTDIKAHIDQDKCISCAECIAMCRFGAVECKWGEETEILQKSMAEHALGTLKGKQQKAVFFNYVMSVTKDCDCFDTPNMPKIVDDIGIVASTDPVAIDKASLDLVEQRTGRKLQELIGKNKLNPRHQLDHAERIGLGSIRYELLEIG
jgi:uncharacterized Fe-S center protein